MPTCLIDSDVIINWLTKEEDPISHEKLWEAPHKIIELIEAGTISGFSTLINLMEIRFVLRRKKDSEENKIKEDIANITKIIEVAIPDEVNLLEANNLQAGRNLELSGVGLSLKDTVLVSRDKYLRQLASPFLPAATPEDFLKGLKI